MTVFGPHYDAEHTRFSKQYCYYVNSYYENHFYSAAALLAMQSAVIPTAILSVRLSVRLSVCPTDAGTLFRRMKIGSRGLHCEVAKHSSFMIPKMVGRRLRPISAYDVQ